MEVLFCRSFEVAFKRYGFIVALSWSTWLEKKEVMQLRRKLVGTTGTATGHFVRLQDVTGDCGRISATLLMERGPSQRLYAKRRLSRVDLATYVSCLHQVRRLDPIE